LKRQRCPAFSGARWYQKIVECKQAPRRGILEALSPRVRQRYASYVTARRSAETLGAEEYNNEQIEALKHCYKPATSALKEMKATLLEALSRESELNLFRCPYCLAREPRTWDHFLPQGSFPEYSVLPLNLIYVCPQCNLEKLDNGVANPRQVINPYFDRLPHAALVRCEIQIVAGVPALHFYPDQQCGASAYILQIISSHFDLFDLESLYIKEGKSLVSSFMMEIRLRFPEGIDANTLSQELAIKAATTSQHELPNDWQRQVWLGLSQNADFLQCLNDYIAGNPPPGANVG
jgi:hypothetical protein